MGGPIPHDAAAGEGIQRNVRDVLHSHHAHYDSRQLRLSYGDHGSRIVVQGIISIPRYRFLGPAGMHVRPIFCLLSTLLTNYNLYLGVETVIRYTTVVMFIIILV